MLSFHSLPDFEKQKGRWPFCRHGNSQINRHFDVKQKDLFIGWMWKGESCLNEWELHARIYIYRYIHHTWYNDICIVYIYRLCLMYELYAMVDCSFLWQRLNQLMPLRHRLNRSTSKGMAQRFCWIFGRHHAGSLCVSHTHTYIHTHTHTRTLSAGDRDEAFRRRSWKDALFKLYWCSSVENS